MENYEVKAVKGRHGGLRAKNMFELGNGKVLIVSTAKYDSGAVQTTVSGGTDDGRCITVAYGRGGDFHKLLASNYGRATAKFIEGQQSRCLAESLEQVKAEALAYYAAQKVEA